VPFANLKHRAIIAPEGFLVRMTVSETMTYTFLML